MSNIINSNDVCRTCTDQGYINQLSKIYLTSRCGVRPIGPWTDVVALRLQQIVQPQPHGTTSPESGGCQSLMETTRYINITDTAVESSSGGNAFLSYLFLHDLNKAPSVPGRCNNPGQRGIAPNSCSHQRKH